ncbi:hypothetical protein EV193_104404 [Herbihabitans rhizosphaerae]|uniref:Uncharacterized protein n=1 Tax=Herbihabitans rhizosphaerae TaxID=1872711 RepID=A0A4Q7KQR5_9PSEU|nr:hypothetical protein EV193_104404 [Herbihabitans rhizosphaerae]
MRLVRTLDGPQERHRIGSIGIDRYTAKLIGMGKHDKPCPACNGAGWVWGTVVDRKTGSRNPHKETCPGCGGTGK